jgi:hypothetical protein
MLTGWQCPRCGVCYAPFVERCGLCMPQTVAAGNANASYTCSGCGKYPCDHSGTGCPALQSSTLHWLFTCRPGS